MTFQSSLLKAFHLSEHMNRAFIFLCGDFETVHTNIISAALSFLSAVC